MNSTSTDTGISIGDWHTASVVTYRVLNDVIQAQGLAPKTFEYNDNSGNATNGTFGAWTLSLSEAGTSGELVMDVAIESGSFAFTDSGTNLEKIVTLTPCVATISFPLTFVPNATSDSVHDLTTDETGTVTVLSVEPAQGEGTVEPLLFQQSLAAWFNENASVFKPVLASVDFNMDYEVEGLSWLKPSHAGYAFNKPVTTTPTLDNSVFAILTLIDGEEPPSELSKFIPVDAIPEGQDASFLISPRKYIEHAILPGMPLIFDGIEKDSFDKNFRIGDDGTNLTNKRELKMAPVEVKDKTEKPTLEADNFNISILTDAIKYSITEARCSYAAGIHILMDYSAEIQISYDKDKGILQSVVTNENSEGEVDVGEGILIGSAIGEVVGLTLLVVGALAGSATVLEEGGVTGDATGDLDNSEGHTDPDNQLEVEEQLSKRQKFANKLVYSKAGTKLGMPWLAARGSAITAFVSGLGFVITVLSTVYLVLELVASGKYKDPELQASTITDAAIGGTVKWPGMAGAFELDTAGVNGVFQFGLKRS